MNALHPQAGESPLQAIRRKRAEAGHFLLASGPWPVKRPAVRPGRDQRRAWLWRHLLHLAANRRTFRAGTDR